MNIDKLISRATHTSGRSLLVLATAVIFSKWYEIPLTNNIISSIFKDIPSNIITIGITIVMVYLIIIHALNWWNDYIGYKASFSVKVLKDHYEPNTIVDGDPPFDWEEHILPIDKANKAQQFSIYGQHCALPIFAGVTAVIWLVWF